MSLSSESLTRRRPDVFRALGQAEPPETLEVDDHEFALVSCLKHDSWAATSLYADSSGRKIACKINRLHPLPGGIPAEALGCWLAGREEKVMREMAGVAGFPRWAGKITQNGEPMPTAVAHWWVEGKPFRPDESVNDFFFPELTRMLAAFQRTGRAYVDMSKWGNILIGDDGCPCLLDYQIHYRAGRCFLSRWILRQLQKGDWFYLRRHWRRCRPDQYRDLQADTWNAEPWHIWLAERAGPFFRGIRIAVLRLSGVRGDPRRDEERACAARAEKNAAAGS